MHMWLTKQKGGLDGTICDGAPWAIVLAGGEGTRLQSLTRTIEGDARPKQFSKIFGSRSLLGHTRDRLRPVFLTMTGCCSQLQRIMKPSIAGSFGCDRAKCWSNRPIAEPEWQSSRRSFNCCNTNRTRLSVSFLQIITTRQRRVCGTLKSAISISKTHIDSIVLMGAKPQWPPRLNTDGSNQDLC